MPNAHQLHDKVLFGGQPTGEPAFAELMRLGVKTIISVDGAHPVLELARKYGMRYVHLPHGYDGIAEERILELAKAVRELPGPIYIHCHHGKHRSPAAATVACVSAGLLDKEHAVGVLQASGTSPAYRGLYRSAAGARRIDDARLDTLAVNFRETVELPPLAEAMVLIERSHDHLKIVATKNWSPSASHPDILGSHEALLLREHFTELLRAEEISSRPERFISLLRESESAAKDLEKALDNQRLRTHGLDSKTAGAAFARITTNCITCHREFRDTPLDEK